MDIAKEIYKWSKQLPSWQRDALRRLVKKSQLADEDIQEVYALLLKGNGLTTKDPAPEPRFLKMDDFTYSSAKGPTVVLKKLHSLDNVNALAPKQAIKFAEIGITVIYGRNATGKSGYARVLKRACRARGEEEILPNVFNAELSNRTASGIFEVEIDGQEKTIIWTDDEDVSPPELSDVQVFDSKCARLYIDEENKIEYIPYGLDIFSDLVELCEILRSKLGNRIDEITSTLTDISLPPEEGSAVYQLIERLSHKTNPKDILELSNLRPAELAKLGQLEKQIAELKTNNPEETAKGFRKKKAAIVNLIATIKAAELELQKGEMLKGLWADATTASEAAKQARKKAFLREPLAGTGSDIWREMFLAAKAFSEKEAYPAKEFPVTTEKALCLLCQQPLAPEACERFTRFAEFIKKESERRALQKRRAYDAARQKFQGISLHSEKQDLEIIEYISTISKKAANALTEYFKFMRHKSKVLVKAIESKSWDNIPGNIDSPIPTLEKTAQYLQDKADEQDKLTDPKARQEIERECAELKSRKWLLLNLKPILSHIGKLDRIHKLESCKTDTRTTEITKHGKQLTESAVTDMLIDSINIELNEIGVKVQLEIKQRGSAGDTYVQLKLPGKAGQFASVSDVLSEGEQRAVAIASFFGELKIAGHDCSIIFDDPVSSLDHVWRERAAKRLVKEGLVRQVIVFTHDIVFAVALAEAADDQDVPLRWQEVYRSTAGIGTCDETEGKSWMAMGVNERINYLLKLYGDAKITFESGDAKGYDINAAHIYNLLRETWEEFVEEILLNKCVERFRADVQTKRLEGVFIEKGDYERVDRGMTKCSKWLKGHDTALGRDDPLPQLNEMRTDIEELQAFEKEIKKRRKHSK